MIKIPNYVISFFIFILFFPILFPLFLSITKFIFTLCKIVFTFINTFFPFPLLLFNFILYNLNRKTAPQEYFDNNIFSNHKTIKRLHSLANAPRTKSSINPWFVTGFTDGEGCFSIGIRKATTSIGWSVGLEYRLVAKNNPANLKMFEEIHNFFGFGHIRVTENNGTVIRYQVNGLQDCLKIREHFVNFPLMTYKLVHFLLWSSILDIIVKKDHLSLSGLLNIIALKAHFSEGLSEKLLLVFSNYTAIEAPAYNPDFTNMNIHWIFGFINADGHFKIVIPKSKTTRLGGSVNFVIQITQHNRSLIVLEEIQTFLEAGNIYSAGINKNVSVFKIASLPQINNFIDLFKGAELKGAKALDYSDFCHGVNLVNQKAHHTEEGFAELKKISAKMNNGRTIF